MASACCWTCLLVADSSASGGAVTEPRLPGQRLDKGRAPDLETAAHCRLHHAAAPDGADGFQLFADNSRGRLSTGVPSVLHGRALCDGPFELSQRVDARRQQGVALQTFGLPIRLRRDPHVADQH